MSAHLRTITMTHSQNQNGGVWLFHFKFAIYLNKYFSGQSVILKLFFVSITTQDNLLKAVEHDFFKDK